MKRVLSRPNKRIEDLSPRPTKHKRNISVLSKSKTPKSVEEDQVIGLLQRPWRRIQREKQSQTVFVMAKRNYKIAAYLGLTRRAMKRFIVVLDTGAGSSFIRTSALSPDLQKLIKP